MVLEAGERRSRRALLAGALGGAAALVGAALAGPLDAAAADGDPVEIGAVNNGSTTTIVKAPVTGFIGQTTAASGKRAGVLGTAPPGDGRGVMGKGPIGVLGQTGSPTGIGVLGSAAGGNAFAILGTNTAASGNAIAIKGLSQHGTAIVGETASTIDAGVEGHSPGIGVFGETSGQFGIGVSGFASGSDGSGVSGSANSGSGVGVFGSASGPTGIGGQFQANGGPGTFALKVIGRAGFSTAASSSVASGVDHKDVTPGVELTGNTTVLATLQSDGGVAIQYVEVHTGTNSFTVHFSGNTTQACTVAWFVLG